jgi:hypothetical protein
VGSLQGQAELELIASAGRCSRGLRSRNGRQQQDDQDRNDDDRDQQFDERKAESSTSSRHGSISWQ